MLKAQILLLATLAIINPISVSANTISQEYLPISVRSYNSLASDYTTLQSYYTTQSLPLIQAKIEEDRRIAEEKRIAEEQEKQKAEQARIAKEKADKIKAAATLSAKASSTSFASFDYESLIRERCNELGCNADQVIRVMYCESGGRANAVNRGGSGASGLFQFMPKTFAANAKRIGLADASIWDPKAQIYVATYMFARGQAGQWSCK